MNNLEKNKYWVWLSLIKGLGIRRKIKLIERYKSPEIIYNLSKKELLNNKEIGKEIANNILDQHIRIKLDEEIKELKKNNIDVISIYDKEYPQSLKEIYDYPVSLYIKGNKSILNNSNIAIIGCRNATEYGIKSAKYFSYNLTKEGFNIVSGMARGIDSYAHLGSICGKIDKKVESEEKSKDIGNTIAVVGNGLDIIYPKENIELAKYILNTGGAIISEYSLGTKPNKMNFPARNRIISGISSKIIVIEAKRKSGTLITVDFALEQGKEIFAVPRKYKRRKFNRYK